MIQRSRTAAGMSVLAEFSIVPMGKGASVSPQIARVMKIVIESGISYRANPMGTVIEGEWDVVMTVVKRCHEEVLKDSERVVTTIKIDDRKGGGQRMDRKLESVEQKLGKKLNQ
jgi:uncharacterized protein (TIGR00106 family)